MRGLAVRSQSRVVGMGSAGVPMLGGGGVEVANVGDGGDEDYGLGAASGRPGALEVGEGVEGVGGGGLALEVDAEAALGGRSRRGGGR